MSPEDAQEHNVQIQVNEVFSETFGRTVNGRIKLAAFAVSEQMRALNELLEEQETVNEGIPSAPKEGGVSFFNINLKGIFVPDEDLSAEELAEQALILRQLGFEDESAPIQNARLALDEALVDARKAYGLTEGQAKRALRLAETTFKLFYEYDQNRQ